MILMREISPEIRWRGTVVESNTTPSTRKRTRMSWPLGSKWMSDAPRRTASAITACTSFTTGASSADSRSSMTSASYVSSSTSCDRARERAELLDQRVDVLGRGDRAAHLVAGGHRDVVEREQVGRVGGRHEQRLLAEEGDRDVLVAARLGGVDQLGGALVHLEDVQVHVVEPVALGERLGELRRVDDARLDQGLARAACRRGGPCSTTRSTTLALGEAELHDHVADAPLDAGALGGRGESRDREWPAEAA